jgi:hypothetical protein
MCTKPKSGFVRVPTGSPGRCTGCGRPLCHVVRDGEVYAFCVECTRYSTYEEIPLDLTDVPGCLYRLHQIVSVADLLAYELMELEGGRLTELQVNALAVARQVFTMLTYDGWIGDILADDASRSRPLLVKAATRAALKPVRAGKAVARV